MNARPSANETSRPTSYSLLARAKERDPQAWDRISELYQPVIYGWCRHSGLQPSDAADVVQEVFRDVAANLANFRQQSPQGSFRGWLCSIARSKVADHYRRAARRPEVLGGSDAHQRMQEVPAPSSDSVADAEESVTGELMLRARELIRTQVSETTWQAFWRYAVQKHAPGDIAADLGISVWSVYAAKSRVLRHLREEFGELID